MNDLIMLATIIFGSLVIYVWSLLFLLIPFGRVRSGRAGYLESVVENIDEFSFLLVFSLAIAAGIVVLNVYGG